MRETDKADSTDRRNAIFVGLSGTPETDPTLPHCDTRRVHFDRRVSPEARDLASLFSTMLGPNLDKHSAVLGLVQDEPALRAGAAGGILDKTCARRSARGRSAPRNGPLSLTKECIWILDPERRHPKPGDIPTRSVPDVA